MGPAATAADERDSPILDAVTPMVRAESLQKRFGQVNALAGLSAHVPQGGLTALLGPNGSGKTTFLRAIATLERADSGSLWVYGLDARSHARDVRSIIGLVAHRSLMYPGLTPRENLRFAAALHGVRLSASQLEGCLLRVALDRVAERPVRTLSHGTVRRLSIARALLHDPPLVLMDEPYSGLDDEAARALDDLLSGLVESGRTVVVATHDPQRISALATHTIELREGRASSAGSDVSPTPPADLGRASGAAMPRPVKPTFVAAAAAVAWKDMLLELRGREALPLALTFALLVAVLFRFALPDAVGGVSQAAAGAAYFPGVLWIALVFGSTLGLGRASAAEQEEGGGTALLLSPADRGALFVGKWLGGLAFTAVVGAALVPAAVVFLGVPHIPLFQVAGIVALGLVGWVAAATLVAAMASAARAREALVPVLLYPVAVPLLVAAIQATAWAIASDVERLPAALVIIGAYDVAFLALGFLAYSAVLEG